MSTASQQNDLNADAPQYDRGIVPAEVAARKEREGEDFGKNPPDSREPAAGDPSTDENEGSFNTADGFTHDQEGLTNNYAIEPEMYINEPGDLREEEQAASNERSAELQDLQTDEAGKLTNEGDERHKGQGMI